MSSLSIEKQLFGPKADEPRPEPAIPAIAIGDPEPTPSVTPGTIATGAVQAAPIISGVITPATMAAPALVRAPVITATVLRACMPHIQDPEGWAGPFDQGCFKYGLGGRPVVAALLAQCGHETGDLSKNKESMNYTPERLRAIFPSYITPAQAQQYGRLEKGRVILRKADEREIAEIVYGGRGGNGIRGTGDGWTFRGTGPTQLTFKNAWSEFGRTVGKDPYAAVTFGETKEGGALSTCWYYAKKGLAAAAAGGDFEHVVLITAGFRTLTEELKQRIDYRDRRRRYDAAVAALA